MAETQIEWTDATWNPVAGCSVISAGCTNCYAMEMAKRLEAMHMEKYAGLTRQSGKRTIWSGIVREDPASLAIPRRWKKSRKIFVNSMSDLCQRSKAETLFLKVPTHAQGTRALKRNFQLTVCPSFGGTTRSSTCITLMTLSAACLCDRSAASTFLKSSRA